MTIKADSVFSGISTFGRLPYFPCLASDDVKYDIAFIGAYYTVDYLLRILSRAFDFSVSGQISHWKINH